MTQKKIETFDNNYKLEIQILQAKITSLESQECDPFAVCSIGKNRYQTNILRKTNTPQWEGKLVVFEIESATKEIQIEVYKRGIVGTKSLIGTTTIILSRLGNNIATTQWYDIIQNGEKNGEKVGSIQCMFKRQKVNVSEEEEDKEKGWVDLLSQINDIIQPTSDESKSEKVFEYYEMKKEENENENEENENDKEKENNEENQENKINEIKEQKQILTNGPIKGFLKIEIENPENNSNKGQKGKITQHIPSYQTIDEEIWNMIFPCGMISSDHPRKPYLLPLFKTEKQTKEKVYYMFLVCDTSIRDNETKYYVPIAIGLYSLYPLYEMMRRMLLLIYELSPTLPLDTKNKIDLLDDREELKKSIKTQNERSQTCKTMNLSQSGQIGKISSNHIQLESIYTPIIKGLYDMMCGDSVSYGGYSKFKFHTLNIEIRLPPKNSLPLFNTPIYPLFSLFNVSGMTTLFLLLMTNLKIVLFSSSLTFLSSSIDNLVSLLYPFQPTQKVIPILPYGNLEALTMVKTFIVGIPNEYRKEAMTMLEDEEFISVDLDNGIIEMNVLKELLEFPVDLTLELQKDLNEAFKEKYMKMDELGNEPYDDKYYLNSMYSFNLKVRLAYFKFITRLLEGYENYINYKWIADTPIYDFDIFKFLLTKSIDCEDLIKHFCESGTFMKYIKQQGFDTVFNEWISKRIFENDLSVLYNHYIKNKKMLVINPTNQNVYTELKDISSFSLDWEDFKKIKQSEGLLTKPKEKEREKYYVYELDKYQFETKKQQGKEYHISVFQQFIQDLRENKQPNLEKVYQCTSSQSGRHLLLNLLDEEIDKIKPKGQLETEAFNWLLQVMKTLVVYCKGDKDIETPLGIVDCASQYCCKIDQINYQFILDHLGKNDIWNNKTIWIRMFNKHMVLNKKKIYEDKYSLQTPTLWKYMNDEEKKRYREKEENGLVTVLHLIAKNMKLIGVENKIIYEVIEHCEKEVNATEEVKQIVLNVIKIILENDSSMIR